MKRLNAHGRSEEGVETTITARYEGNREDDFTNALPSLRILVDDVVIERRLSSVAGHVSNSE